MRNKKWLWMGGAAAGVVLVVVVSVTALRSKRTAVQAERVTRKDSLVSLVTASGEIRPKKYVDISSNIMGRIVALAVKEGDSVREGDLLVRIDSAQSEAETRASEGQLQAALADAQGQQFQIATAEANYQRDQASLEVAEAELVQVQSNLKQARNTFARVQQLHEENLVSREEYERAQTQVNALQAQLEASRSRVAQMEAQVKVMQTGIEHMKALHQAALGRVSQARAYLARSRDMLGKTVITAPLSGVITSLNIQEGEIAIIGVQNQPGTVLMTIADMGVIETELKVDETDIVNVKVGQKAKVTVDALPDQPIDATVTEVGSSAIAPPGGVRSPGVAQEARDFKAVVQLLRPPAGLRPGLSATAEIITATKKNVLAIPQQALVKREVSVDQKDRYLPPPEGKGKAAQASDVKQKKKELDGVFVIGKDRYARLRPVKTGIVGGMEVEILEGLQEGEQIVTGDYKTLRKLEERTPVKVESSKKK